MNNFQKSKACYRSLKKYKYQLVEEFVYDTGISGFDIDQPFIKLNNEGVLTVSKNYAWDGASGPTIDTKNSMRASLVHDALYQLMRERLLSQDQVKPADQLFEKMLRNDGMSAIRARIWYLGLRLANGMAAKPGTQKPPKIICVPKD
ncbi:DUF1353 domain-containing protein [Reichenbachiella versicolor]|uniref:DUF1353 domain-containing protein n=1 Tax=Reichenbachiella versicolor TaxID=1821036 RepID=UPI000D6DF6BC|nr:DUF1353 domain-containing protein [Reichenbachiella versicolor]